MSFTKKVTISLTPEHQEKARSLSNDLFGKEEDDVLFRKTNKNEN